MSETSVDTQPASRYVPVWTLPEGAVFRFSDHPDASRFVVLQHYGADKGIPMHVKEGSTRVGAEVGAGRYTWLDIPNREPVIPEP